MFSDNRSRKKNNTLAKKNKKYQKKLLFSIQIMLYNMLDVYYYTIVLNIWGIEKFLWKIITLKK